MSDRHAVEPLRSHTGRAGAVERGAAVGACRAGKSGCAEDLFEQRRLRPPFGDLASVALSADSRPETFIPRSLPFTTFLIRIGFVHIGFVPGPRDISV